MPKKAKPLSAVEVRRLSEPGLHAVGEVAGLHLQIAKGGSKSWILRIRIGSKRRDMGLGGFPDVSLSQARAVAREMRVKVSEGIDAVEERKSAKRARIDAQAKCITFEQAAKVKHQSIASESKNKRHRDDWLSTLRRHAFPILGGMDVAAIETAHVLAVLRPIWETKTETATRLRQRIEAVLSWATVAGYRQGDNPARWADNLKELLSRPAKVRKRKHFPALQWQEVPGFMAALGVQAGIGARALEVAILTAARSGEVRGMTWSELEGGIWTIPAEKMKAGRKHVIPLPPRALAIIKALPKIDGSPYVFTSPRGNRLSDMTLSAVCRRMGVNAVPHGFRSSFKDWARNRSAYMDEVSELCLAHVNSDATRAAYARDGLLSQRANMLKDWANFCGAPFIESGDVVNLMGRRA